MKRNYLRVIAALLAALMLTLPLASCGGNDDKVDTSPSPDTSVVPSEVPTPSPTPEYITEYIGTVYNVSSFLNVRSGPGTNYDKVGEAHAGDKYTVLEQNVGGSEWHKISFSGIEGYVHSDYLTIEAIQVEVTE